MNRQMDNPYSAYICIFDCFVREANIALKFPCQYFVTWKTLHAKINVKTEKHSPHENHVTFQQHMILDTELMYDRRKSIFLKKQTLIQIYLVSKSRPDQNKYVGRVTIDLAKIINVGMYAEPTQFQLNFCSVQSNSSIIMQFNVNQKRLTSLPIQKIDTLSFINFMSRKPFKYEEKRLQNSKTMKNLYELQQRSYKNSNRIDFRATSPTLVSEKLELFIDNERSLSMINKSNSLTRNRSSQQFNYFKEESLDSINQADKFCKKSNFYKNKGLHFLQAGLKRCEQPEHKRQNSDSLIYSKQLIVLGDDELVQGNIKKSIFFQNKNKLESKNNSIILEAQNLLDEDIYYRENSHRNTIQDYFKEENEKKITENSICSNNKLIQTKNQFNLINDLQFASCVNDTNQNQKTTSNLNKKLPQLDRNRENIIRKMNQQIISQTEIIEGLAKQKKSLKNKLQSYICYILKFDKMNQQILSLKQDNTELRNKIIQIGSNSEESESKINRQEAYIKDLEQLNQIYLNQITERSNNNNCLQAQLNKILIENLFLKNSNESLTYQVHQIKSHLMDQQSALKDKEQRIIKQSDELKNIMKIKDSEIKKLTFQISNQESSIAILQKKLNQLNLQLNDTLIQKIKLESINKQIDNKFKELNQQHQNILKSMEKQRFSSKKEQSMEILGELKRLLMFNNMNPTWQNIKLKINLNNNQKESITKIINLEETFRTLLKELYIIKGKILKTEGGNRNEKITYIGFFKRFESIIVEIIMKVEYSSINSSHYLQ